MPSGATIVSYEERPGVVASHSNRCALEANSNSACYPVTARSNVLDRPDWLGPLNTTSGTKPAARGDPMLSPSRPMEIETPLAAAATDI